MKKIHLCIALLATLTVAKAQLNTVDIRNFEELKSYFKQDQSKPIIISGHRGGMMPGYPENSIEAFEKTLSIIPSFFEIDPQLTKDSVLILMHDDTLDRTTTLKGKVKEYTYDDIKKANLKDREGKVTNFKIPTLKEALDWSQGKTIFQLDNKGVPYATYVKFLKENPYPNIVLGLRKDEEVAYYAKHLDHVMFMKPFHTMKDVRSFEELNIPFNRMIAWIGGEVKEEQKEMIAYLRSKGVMVMIAIAPTTDKLPTDLERTRGYIRHLINRPDIIETDYPAQFINW
ncbi:glycerophosphodiester phosphodiesterase [Empedobacter brevis]|uniref:glycerophosphodiester phosphodiesterase family protein n=1 Tax=Empedobacter brevis TaxID=247 RepID=UPI00132051E3|nr:glycerophosphodiester phosphodiesterase family protein [Empedobacter brevis]QHC83707.1 glycerophosphodiester phosphodiesterase [Empedobacter brevis]